MAKIGDRVVVLPSVFDDLNGNATVLEIGDNPRFHLIKMEETGEEVFFDQARFAEFLVLDCKVAKKLCSGKIALEEIDRVTIVSMIEEMNEILKKY